TSRRPSGFVYDQWARALFLPEQHTPPVMLPELSVPDKTAESEGSDDNDAPSSRKRPMLDEETIQSEKQVMLRAVSTASDAFTCRRNSWCLAKSGKGPVVVSIIDTRYVGLACDIGDIAITSRYTTIETCRSGALLFSAQTLRRTGSLEITFSP